MKKSNLVFSIIILSIIIGNIANGNNNSTQVLSDSINFNENPIYGDGSEFEGWTEEQLIEYEDSLIKVLYPIPKIRKTERTLPEVIHQPSKMVASLVPTNPHVPNEGTVYVDDSDVIPGIIPINSDVTQTGARTYDIPIEVYPGINGMQPNLSISYNSQRPNSIMGPGWTIAGLSVITRVGKCRYYDDTTDGITMTLNDSFSLDGYRLIKKNISGDYILYQSETGNIYAKGFYAGDIIKYFEVFYPDGNKGIFGLYSNTKNQIEYPIYSMLDLHGNTMDYTYNKEEGNRWINKITYNTSASVEFEYIPRTVPLLSYKGGEKIVDNIVLNSLAIKFNSNTLATYIFTYQTHRNLPLLISIDLNSKDKYYNPICFYYGKGCDTNGWNTSSTELLEWYEMDEERTSLKVMRGRFEYESGTDGLITYPILPTYWRHYGSSGKERRFDNYYTGTEKIFLYTGLSTDLEKPAPNLITGPGFIDILCADLLGNQEEFIVKINNQVVDNMDEITFTSYQASPLSSGSNITKRHTRTFKFPTIYVDSKGGKSVNPKFYYTGDFNGDGKMEILAISADKPFGDTSQSSKCYIFDLEGNRILFQGNILNYNVVFIGTQLTDSNIAFNNSDKLLVMDYDGDGKTDIIHINNSGTDIYTFDITQNILSARKVTTYANITIESLKDRDLLEGDFNGDGLIDFLISPPSSTTTSIEWTVHYSKGNGQFEYDTFYPLTGSQSIYKGYIAHDVNGDGLCDLIEYSDNGFGVFLGKSNYPDGNNRYANTYKPFPEEKSILVPVDINSHNCFPQLLSLKNGIATKYSFKTDESMETLLTGVSNNHGAVEKTYYRKIDTDTQSEIFYQLDTDAVFPYVNIIEPLPVVEATETFLKGTSIDNTRYSYANAVFHRQGLGFRGFGTVNIYNKRGQLETTKYDPYCYGLPKTIKSPYSERTYTFNVTQGSDKIANITLNNEVEKDILKNNTITTTYQYDNLGYPVKESCVYSDGFKIITERTYSHTTSIGDGYNLGFLTKESKILTNASGTYSETQNIVSHHLRQPLKIRKSINTNISSEEDYSYDSFGNKTSEAFKPYSSSNKLEKTYVYNSLGQLTKETNELGLSTEYTYNEFGKVKSSKNARGGITTYEYDEFNRPISITEPDGACETTEYSWVIDGNDGIYKTVRNRTGQPETVEYRDAMNRVVRTSELRFDGTEHNAYRRYDEYGNLSSESLPYAGTIMAVSVNYTYDTYNRPIKCSGPGKKEVSWSYNGNKTITNENGLITTRTYNPRGEIIKVEDPGGEITYIMAPDGKPINIKAGNLTTTFDYDDFRRRIELSDPSLGTMEWSYDEAGNLSEEKDANHKIITYTYDSFNRIISRETPEFTTTYTYNIYGDITRIASSNESSTSFSYDQYGKLSSISEYGSSRQFFTKKYQYSSGNIESVTYSSTKGKLAKESYVYSNGHLSEILLNDSTIIFKLNQENDYGKPSSVTTGNLTRTYKFSQTGYPTERKVSSGNRLLQSHSYSFDNDEKNLLSRTDDIRDITETFEYDVLNRLIKYGNETATYSNNGNVLSRSDIGSFRYGILDKPYALSGVTQTDTRISLKPQSITYTSFARPAKISENTYSAEFIYNADSERIRMSTIASSGLKKSIYYLGGNYEAIFTGTSTTPEERLYLGGNYYSAPVVLIKNGSKVNLYYILRDYLGSITGIVDGSGNIIQELSYDVWGNIRNPENHEVYTSGNMPKLLIGRGYTGHEHLTDYGLINMNARLYDPALGRFLSPDPYVQNPETTQSYNRYSYCLNNPLAYVDENGELFLTIITAIVDIYRNVINHGLSLNKYDFKRTKNAFKIDLGMFNGNFAQVINKWTWGVINSIVGNVTAHAYNIFGKVDNVTNMNGMLALSGVTTTGSQKAMTIGHYSFGPKGYSATWKDHLFVHEYGHYIQSQRWGPLFLLHIGIPSLLSAMCTSEWTGRSHKDRWFEVDASYLGSNYFDKKYGRGHPDYDSNSADFFDINSFRTGQPSKYCNPRSFYNPKEYEKSDYDPTKFKNNHKYPTRKPDNKNKFTIWDFIL